MNDKVYNRTYQALKNLYLNSKEIQKQIKPLALLNDLSYAKEICTIRMATARRSGHTSSIAKFVNKYNDKNWAIIPPTMRQVEEINKMVGVYSKGDILKQTQSYIEFKNGRTQFMTANTFNRDLRGLDLDGIIVDCAFYLSQSKIEELYQVGMPCMRFKPYKFFIFVG